MKERPIIFGYESVLALLEGRKTQTRRVIKPEWSRCLDFDDPDDIQKAIDLCPYGIVGDRLWVRETRWHSGGGYVVGGKEPFPNCGKISPIFMPRYEARIILEITSVRVEQLQSITKHDAYAEGYPDRVNEDRTPIGWYQELWDSINKKRGYPWESNCWVWIIEFIRKEMSHGKVV